MCNAQGAMQGALALQGMGAVSSAVGSFYGAQSQKQALDLQASLGDINARMSESAAQQTLLTGERDEQRSMIATANLKGTQRAGLAANGVDLGVGSAANILTSTDVLGEADSNTIHANAVRSAMGYRVQAANQSSQATMSRASASAISPTQALTTSLLGSAGSVAASWYRYRDKQDEDAANSSADPIATMNSRKGWTS